MKQTPKWSRYLMVLALTTSCVIATHAEIDIDYGGGVTVNAGSEKLAPYYIASNRGGTVTQQLSTLINLEASHKMDTTQRLSYGFGLEMWGGYASAASYQHYDAATDAFAATNLHPSRAWIQQLYAEGKYRSMFLTIGAKKMTSTLVNQTLSSGDLIMSENARPFMGFRMGFIDFQNIPFTSGWLQIAGEVGYFKSNDGNWLKDHYNYYSNFVTTDYWFNYKKAYFRTRPDQRLVLTIGAQASCQFGGTQNRYNHAKLVEHIKMKANAQTFFHTLIPGKGGNNIGDLYVEGNHLGSWDIALDYKLPHGNIIRGYYQNFWEDGSSVGKLNGFDGLWGIEFRSTRKSFLNGITLEYLDFTNQSGPIHWAPNDHPDTPIEGQATGGDNYYNNYAYNGYHAFGMSIGSPFIKSPLYHRDGYMRYVDNLVRGVHVGITGNITPDITYRALASYRKAWGNNEYPRATGVSSTSMMLEMTCRPHRLPHLAITTQLAFDSGQLYGNNAGGLVSIAYYGNLSLGK